MQVSANHASRNSGQVYNQIYFDATYLKWMQLKGDDSIPTES